MQTCLQISEILLTFAVTYKYRDLRVQVSDGWVQEQRQTCFLNLLLCPYLGKEGSRGEVWTPWTPEIHKFSLYIRIYIYIYIPFYFSKEVYIIECP